MAPPGAGAAAAQAMGAAIIGMGAARGAIAHLDISMRGPPPRAKAAGGPPKAPKAEITEQGGKGRW